MDLCTKGFRFLNSSSGTLGLSLLWDGMSQELGAVAKPAVCKVCKTHRLGARIGPVRSRIEQK